MILLQLHDAAGRDEVWNARTHLESSRKQFSSALLFYQARHELECAYMHNVLAYCQEEGVAIRKMKRLLPADANHEAVLPELVLDIDRNSDAASWYIEAHMRLCKEFFHLLANPHPREVTICV